MSDAPGSDGPDAAGGPPPPEEPAGYRTEQFAFVDEEAPEEPGWLAFGDSRAGRRADRRERFRERVVVLGVLAALAGIVAGVLLWRPWSSATPPDPGELALGGDRVAVLMQVQDTDGGALASAVLLHDRRAGGRGAAVAVPPDLVLPVAGEDTVTVRSALDAAGPTRSRESLGALLGLDLAGSWVLDRTAFAALVDRIGGLAAGATSDARLDGQAALDRLGGGGTPDAAGPVLGALAGAFPPTFTATRELLLGLGVLDAPDLPLDRLAAVLAGLAGDSAAQRLSVAALPLEQGGRNLDVAGALPVVRDILGGVPGGGRGGDVTPRVLVRLADGAGVTAADVRADVVNAGYEYVDGGSAGGAPSSVTVRAGLPDAQTVGEEVATTLGLPTSVVRVADDVPFTADVAVVVGAGTSPQD